MKLTTFKRSTRTTILTKDLGHESIMVSTPGGLRLKVARSDVARDDDSHDIGIVHGRAAKILAKRYGWLGTFVGGLIREGECAFVQSTDSVGISK